MIFVRQLLIRAGPKTNEDQSNAREALLSDKLKNVYVYIIFLYTSILHLSLEGKSVWFQIPFKMSAAIPPLPG
jgi:hypothetical protein